MSVPGDLTPSNEQSTDLVVNDIHGRLSATTVAAIRQPRTVEEVQSAVRDARQAGLAISIAGGRHAMGGQQFGTGTLLLDMTALDRVRTFDAQAGEIEVEAGIQWPELIDYLVETQRGRAVQWGIIQKQTGADRLTLGGALAANIHGRGLRLRPLIADVVAFTLVDATGEIRRCDREENADLFRLAIGGYGLFGAIVSVRLRLVPRQKVQRIVAWAEVAEVPDLFAQRIAEGYLYGDWQFSIDDAADDYLGAGICSCYHPVDEATSIPEGQRVLSRDDWQRLIALAHTDKPRAVAAYRAHYLATSGQVYWSDTQQLADYTDGYHEVLDRQLGSSHPATEMITELYVPRGDLPRFMAAVARDFRAHGVEPIYGTVRLIERDEESFLAWARESFAGVIFNLHTIHTPEGLAHATAAFRRLFDLAIAHGGSFYLTYGRFATRQQISICYPQFAEFLRLKRVYDPEERFQSDWYRHYRDLFAAPTAS